MLVNDGGEFDTPLNLDKVKEIEQLRVYDRHQVTRQRLYEDPADKRFGKPETWMISPMRGAPYEVHETRCLIFDGARVPARVREENDGWGGSTLQYVYEQMMRFGMSQYWANALLERAQQAVHGIPELTNLLRSKDGETLIKKRIALVDMARSINNTVVIDSTETYDLKATALSGVADLIDRFALALSAVTGIPESLLFGRQKSGLSNTGGADMENWYASIAQDQNLVLLEPLDRLVTVQLYAMKRYTDDYLIKFKPLFVPTAKEIADTRKTRAETAQIYHGMGSLDSSEARKTLGDEGFDIDEIELIGEDLREETPTVPEAPAPVPEAPAAPVTSELDAAKIDLLRAQAESLRTPRQDAAPVQGSKLPDVVINVQPPAVDVNLGGIRLDMPSDVMQVHNHIAAPVIEAPNVTVNVPTQPAPVVTVHNDVKAPVIDVKIPLKKTTTVVTRDENDEMTGSVSTEEFKE
jgi:phage-related protein (TIGR01555 family)